MHTKTAPLNFVRCQRADGSFYGTAGTCRKGSKAPPLEKILRVPPNARPIGRGAFATAYDVGDGVVVKQGQISTLEARFMDELKNIEGIPKLIGHRLDSGDDNEWDLVGGVLAMTMAQGKPLTQQNPANTAKGWEGALSILKEIHKAGWAHGDLNYSNVLYDSKSQKTTLIDFGISTKNDPINQLNDALAISKELIPSAKSPSKTFLRNVKRYKRKYGNDAESIEDLPLTKQQQIIKDLWKGV